MSKKNIIFSHPTGNAFSKATLKGLLERRVLFKFFITVAVFPGNFLFRISAFGWLNNLRKRQISSDLKSFTVTSPWVELIRQIAPKVGFNQLTTHETGRFCVDAVYAHLDKKISKEIPDLKIKGATAVYAYEDGAYHSFKAAKAQNMGCLYDLPIGYWKSARNLLLSEKYKNPDWFVTMAGFKDSKPKLDRKDEEIRMADHIFVASSFTATTLQDFSGSLPPVSIIPYGFPDVTAERRYVELKDRKLKILYVGGLSQRKGISYMFDAVNSMSEKVTLTIVGKRPVDDCKVLNDNLEKHQWIESLPHDEILSLMKEHDVLLFPSLFEGFGLVVTEAMSQGTPVITTDRTCGPDLITHGINSWLITAASVEAIVDQLQVIIDDPDCLEQIGRAAMEKARSRPWQIYSEESAGAIIGALDDLVKG